MVTPERRKELRELSKELVALMLKRAGITKRDIYDVAMRRWVNANLDLLTEEERKRFEDILSL